MFNMNHCLLKYRMRMRLVGAERYWEIATKRLTANCQQWLVHIRKLTQRTNLCDADLHDPSPDSCLRADDGFRVRGASYR